MTHATADSSDSRWRRRTMRGDQEKRRKLSREAARKRRRLESDTFADLCRLLPLPPSVTRTLDKPSVIRLTLSYMRTHALFKDETDGGQSHRRRPGAAEEDTSTFLSVLEGFLMVLSTEGDVILLSDNVSHFMGLTQTDLMGRNIFEVTHPSDHEEIHSNLCLTAEEAWCGADRDFIMRIKSAPTHRGRNSRSAAWKVLHCRGRAKVCVGPWAVSCLLLTCQPLPLSHTLLSTHTFTSQHSMDMRFTHCDHRVTLLLGYRPEELLGRSIYQVCHVMDTECLAKNHLNLCFKSLSVSGPYRILVKGGGYVWAETHGAVIPSVQRPRSRPAAPQLLVLCVTYVLSGVEEPSLHLQLQHDVSK
ncbi:endothelial PAS domain-containing protein 1 [Takifugu rubripes]|uniref:endothelial PAS domain-containing protein 1 n=1 Tax=Takifugu rubripes TaxID=31033 RepID=UPI0011458543|nr:endothelial PAS domain-containing protein 1 [Takifugu rubripes]